MTWLTDLTRVFEEQNVHFGTRPEAILMKPLGERIHAEQILTIFIALLPELQSHFIALDLEGG